MGTISRRHEIPHNNILEVKIFDMWAINFMGLLSPSNGNLYILMVVDYVSRWVKAVSLLTNNASMVVKFLKKNIFCRFGTPEQSLVIEEYIL